MEMTKFRIVTAKVHWTVSHSAEGDSPIPHDAKQNKPVSLIYSKGNIWWVKILLMSSGVPKSMGTDSSWQPDTEAPS